jgi:tRNA dimethylallyltransferase
MNLYCILGPTSSGKTDLSLRLASQLEDVWIVNCDSRQVYKDLNIGTGKISGQWQTTTVNDHSIDYYLGLGHKHLLIDYIDTEEVAKGYSIFRFLADYTCLINQIQPLNIVLVGGTGWYARSIYNSLDINQLLPRYDTNYNSLKTFIKQKKLTDLKLIYGTLCTQNTCFRNLKIINNSDWNNPVRLQNYILEMITENKMWTRLIQSPKYSKISKLAIIPDIIKLQDLIQHRLYQRIDQGLIWEVANLSDRLRSEDLDRLGLEYRITGRYLRGQLNQNQYYDKLLIENLRYAKRQISWINKFQTIDDISIVKSPEEGLTNILANLKK